MTLRDPVPFIHPTEAIVGHAPAVQALRVQMRHLAAFDTVGNPHVPTLLLQGETGSGKGLVARLMHASGPRAPGPFVDVNCAAIPEMLLEAEMFGFEAGAFTDAKRAKPGLWEAASAGTLFLDEIEALPLPLQAKLLTTIEARRVRRLGAVAERSVDVKLIVATKEDLREAVAAGRFRADLYHRLAVVVLVLPPLRARGDDVVMLAQHFLHQYAEAHRLRPKRLQAAAEGWLQRYHWPGNVRELRHLMERVTLLHPEGVVDVPALERLCLPQAAPQTASGPAQSDSGAADEPTQIRQALLRTGGNVVRAARLLGVTRNALRYRMQRYGILRQPWEEVPPGGGAAPPLALPRDDERASPPPSLEPQALGVGWSRSPWRCPT
jgi:two-component system response regulator AtoC